MGGYESRRESEVPLTLVSPPLHRKGKEMQYCYLAQDPEVASCNHYREDIRTAAKCFITS